jgi:hypothetical protein
VKFGEEICRDRDLRILHEQIKAATMAMMFISQIAPINLNDERLATFTLTLLLLLQLLANHVSRTF